MFKQVRCEICGGGGHTKGQDLLNIRHISRQQGDTILRSFETYGNDAV